MDADQAELGPELALRREEKAGNLGGIEGHRGGAKNRSADLDVDRDHRNPDRPHELVEDLDDRLVEFEGGRDGEAEDRGEAEKRKQGKGDAEPDGEGDAVGSDALGELRGDRAEDAPTEK